jgi:hypothetical protein
MFNIGDKVAVLDDDFEGTVRSFKNNEIVIETTDGFMMTFHANELIKLNKSNDLEQNIKNFNSTQIKKEKEIEKSRHIVKEKKKTPEIGVPEFDLHIEKLVKNFRGMSNYDILTLQTETAKRHLDFAIRNRIPKIVFIHGVGEGILKAELDFLFGRYSNLSFQDGNFQKYGQGATEIYFKQNVK